MRLSEIYTRLFDSGVRQRGAEYFTHGKIRFRKMEPRSVIALAYGSESYVVTLDLSLTRLTVCCSCPHYETGNLCKHLWAVMVALDSKLWFRPETEVPPQLVTGGDFGEGYYDDDEYDESQEYEDEAPNFQPSRKPFSVGRPHVPASASATPTPPPQKTWRDDVSVLHTVMTYARPSPHFSTPTSSEIITYEIDLASSTIHGQLFLSVTKQAYGKNGILGEPKPFQIDHNTIPSIANADDRQILLLLIGGQSQTADTNYWNYTKKWWRLLPEQLPMLIPLIAATGRCTARAKNGEVMKEITWRADEPLQARLRLVATPNGGYTVSANVFRHDGSIIATRQLSLMIPGLALLESTFYPLHDNGMIPWVQYIHTTKGVYIPADEVDQFLEAYYNSPTAIPIELPDQLAIAEASVSPTLILRLSHSNPGGNTSQLSGALSFAYNSKEVGPEHPANYVYNAAERQLTKRDHAAEQAATTQLFSLGFRARDERGKRFLTIPKNKFTLVIRTLNEAGWIVEAEGKLYRSNGMINIAVQSGIDWFEVHGAATFGGVSAELPQILMALREGRGAVLLDDGTYGVLPEEWLKKYGMISQLGEPDDGHFRFQRSQTGLLDMLLMAQPEITFDKGFRQARQQLQKFQSIKPAQAPRTFAGTLRQYQKEGLGWMQFLQKFQLGGCLADDMGLGKTVQVLALLESRRRLRQKAEKAATEQGGNGKEEQLPEQIPPSLVVVPKSLIFNWIAEAAKFAPNLRVLNNTGLTRRGITLETFGQYDVILTTYGTLRNDVPTLKDFRFDYLILDEAQAIKNASTASAKAVRLLQGNHKLAMSGTPIENHVGELWSLFEFLNPGMLGGSSFFQTIGADAKPDDQSRKMLAHALRPFILRRTKEQVAPELPAKTEQTIYCELEPIQRKLYNDLREHYRATLLGLVEDKGLNRSKIQILEALLRLRQLACHPGLIDKTKLKQGSAKLDTLIPQIVEVVEEGHKVLVFSQFTSFLAIVKNRLDAKGLNYEYLDGKTTNRQEHVERFQNDPNCKIFLISLKAGGLGLNLTAAEYVFLLDPWWNPAVEAQAIDRAHRIGQQQTVFAYRLIARDTVEEQVLKLQESKRELADAIINADNALIRNLSKEDLELLLS